MAKNRWNECDTLDHFVALPNEQELGTPAVSSAPNFAEGCYEWWFYESTRAYMYSTLDFTARLIARTRADEEIKQSNVPTFADLCAMAV